MSAIDRRQDTTNAKLNQRHDEQYFNKLNLAITNHIEKEEEHIETVLTEVNKELTENVEKKKRKAKADVEKDAKKDQVSSSRRLATEQNTTQTQAPILKAPEKRQQEREPLLENDSEDINKELAEETNFIAVMAESMTEGIRTGQMMFQFDWDQSTSDWQNQLSHASAIQTAMEQSGDAQAKATQEQAHRSYYDGIINVSMAGLSLAIGLGGAAKEAYDAENQAAKKAAGEVDSLKDKAASGAADAEKEAAGAASKLENEAASDANKASKEAQAKTIAEDPSGKFWQEQEDNAAKASKTEARIANAGKGGAGPSGNPRLEAGKEGLSTAGKLMKGVYEGFIKAAQIGVPLQMMAQGSSGVGVDSPSQSREANDQRDAAYAQAQSEALQLHASGYGEHYNKTEDARQAVSSAIKFFTDEFQSVPGTIVQALGSYHV